MRKSLPFFLGLLMAAFAATVPAPAADVNWTNPSGGNWSNPANWSPSFPGPTDHVFITLPGAYTVTQDVSATVASFTLGDGTGTPTLTNAGHTLTLSGPSVVRRQAVFALSGGTLAGDGVLVIDGLGMWTDGQIAHATSVTVGSGGVLEITGPATKILRGVLSNGGFVRLTGVSALALCAGTVENLADGVIDYMDADAPSYSRRFYRAWGSP